MPESAAAVTPRGIEYTDFRHLLYCGFSAFLIPVLLGGIGDGFYETRRRQIRPDLYVLPAEFVRV